RRSLRARDRETRRRLELDDRDGAGTLERRGQLAGAVPACGAGLASGDVADDLARVSARLVLHERGDGGLLGAVAAEPPGEQRAERPERDDGGRNRDEVDAARGFLAHLEERLARRLLVVEPLGQRAGVLGGALQEVLDAT